MKFNIVNIGNKEWTDFRSDISHGLFFALENLNYDVEMSINNVQNNKINILVGVDILANDQNNVQNIINSGCEYIIFEVEMFDGKTINYRSNLNIDNYKLLIEGAKFIMTPYKKNLKPYIDLLGHEKVLYVKWGFYEQLIDNRFKRKEDFLIDAFFYGMLKGKRLQKMNHLVVNKKCKIKVLSVKDPLTLKSYYVSKCKWGLNLSSGEEEQFINPFRLYYMAANKMPILSDYGNDDDGYLELCEVKDFENFHNYINDGLPNLESLYHRCRSSKLHENLKYVL